jgi:retinoid hydroxylase
MRARRRIVVQLKELMMLIRTSSSSANNNSQGLLATLQQARDEETGETLTEDEIFDNLFTLVFAGSDTSSSAAVSIWIVLSKNPKLKQQLKMTATDSNQLDTFVQGILEAFPPAPFNMRKTTQDLEVGGYRIPAKWQVGYGFAAALEKCPVPQEIAVSSSSSLSTSSSSSSSTLGGGAASSLAFGQGPRKCPGRYLATSELKAFTKALVQTEWQLDPDQNLEQRYTPGYFPVDQLRVKFV